MKIKNLALSFAAIFLLAGCNNNSGGSNGGSSNGGTSGESKSDSSEHTHTFSSDWDWDKNTHWHPSTCGDDVKGSESAHIFDEGVVTDPTYEKEGYTTYTCTVCGYSYKDKTTEMLKHNYSSEWKSDDAFHWHACTDEGYEDLKINYESHNCYYIKTVEPTYTEDGYRLYECSYCGYERKETISKKEHNYSSEWSMDYDYHWHACLDEGYENDATLIKDKAKHTLDSDGKCTVCELVFSTKLYFVKNDTVLNVQPYYSVCGLGYEASKKIAIPRQYEGLDVLEIRYDAFNGYNNNACKDIENIIIPDTVINIGNYAFYMCWNLKSIYIPSSVTSIGSHSFERCDSVTSIIVDEANKKYDSRDNCNALIKTETNTLLAGCKKSSIPSDILHIGDFAFCNIHLPSLTLPNGLLTIGDGAFNFSLTLNDSFKHIALIIPDTVTEIGDEAFYCCAIEELTLSNNLTLIGKKAFMYCNRLISLTIPKSVTTIGTQAFASCNKLTSVVVDENNTKYDSRDKCNAIIEKATDTLIIGFKFSTIPSTVKAIGDYAFSYFNGETLTIPQGVTSIGDYAFDDSMFKNVTFANTVTSIGKYAFHDCRDLISLTIESGATSSTTSSWAIGDFAFYWCSALTTVKLGDNIKSIGKSAFAYCKALKDVTLPKSLTSIGASAFYLCTSIESITLPTSLKSIGKYAFSQCSALTAIEIPDSVTSIDSYAFSDCALLETATLTTATLSKNLTSIAKGLFAGCSSLESLVIPDCVTIIGSSAFSDCETLSSITIPDNVTSIGSYAFSNCKNLSSISIPSSVTSVGGYAFSECSSLESISLPGVTIISSYVFSGCSKLSSITLSDNLTEIDMYGFANSTALKDLVVSTSVTKIGEYAFSSCAAFEHFFYKGSNEEFKKVEVHRKSELEDSKIYYYSETEPTESGNYWHYVDNVPTVWAAQ